MGLELQTPQQPLKVDLTTPPQSVLQRPLRVLLDARKLGDGGIGVYIENLIEGFRANSAIQLTLLVRPGALRSYRWQNEFKVIESDARSYSWEEYWNLPKRIDFSGFDLFHEPHYTLPFRLPIPTVVTVHDLIHVRYPERWYYPYIARTLIRSALKRATRVLTVSRASASEICKLEPGTRGKLKVIPNSIDPLMLNPVREREYLNRFGIRGPYIMAVLSNMKPHKGAQDLLTAFRQVKSANYKELRDLSLVLVGIGTQDLERIRPALDEALEYKDVHVLGRVSREDLVNLYGWARALVVPSLIEGFCLPALEAKACGTPIIARPDAAVLELLSRSDYVAEDFSVKALERVLSFALRDLATRDRNLRKIDRTLEVGRVFNRTLLCRQVLDVYRDAVRRA